jgi:hypothetical protein
MRFYSKILAISVLTAALAGPAFAQQEDLITVKDSGTHILPTSKTLTVRNIRSMKLNVVTGTGQQISYTASITANKMGMERHFGDGKLKFSVVDQAGLLEYKPFAQPERREESWLKSLFTKEVRYDAKVDRAEMTLTVPDDVLLTIDSQYSDISVGGLKRALSIVGRNGVVNVKDHFGDLRIDNMFGNVSIANIRGEASIASRSSKVTADNIEGRFALTGQSIDFKGTKLLAGAIIDNHRGKNNVSDVETDVRINSNYGDIQLSNVRGMATITSQYPSKINVERVEGLRANIERGELSINNLGSVIGVSVTGKYAKVTGSGIKGSLIVEGERNTIDVENVEKDVMIRNTYGSVSLDGVKGQLMLTGNNNTINFGNVSGERVDIDQSRSLIKGDFTGSIRKISITNNNGDVEIGVGSSFTGRYTLRNEDGLIQHNFGSSLFSEEATLVREVSGGNSNAQTEIRIVNRNGRLIVRKQ